MFPISKLEDNRFDEDVYQISYRLVVLKENGLQLKEVKEKYDYDDNVMNIRPLLVDLPWRRCKQIKFTAKQKLKYLFKLITR